MVVVIVVLVGDGGDFDLEVEDDLRAAGAGTGGELLFEIRGVGRVHLVIILDVFKPDGDADQIVEGVVVLLEDGSDVFHDLVGLGVDRFLDVRAVGGAGDLAADKEEAIGFARGAEGQGLDGNGFLGRSRRDQHGAGQGGAEQVFHGGSP